jgi:glycosyltransferase involved in cell wall biosynthesis
VHLGALGRARGAFAMLDVLAALGDGTRLVTIGRFTDGSEAEFHARAAALGLSHRVEAHPWMEREAAIALAARCDVALVLFQPGVENHRLALPHKLFDAMLAGLPVIVPAFAEEVAAVVAEARCGIAVDVADPLRIAAAVRRLGDPALRAAMGEAGRAAAIGRFGWDGEAERLVALHRRLLAGRPAPGPVPRRIAAA